MSKSTQHSDLFHGAAIDNECKLSFATAAGCAAMGACGILVNYVSPGSTRLDGLVVVGAFYWLHAMASFIAVNGISIRAS